jgi:hypothetical protein
VAAQGNVHLAGGLRQLPGSLKYVTAATVVRPLTTSSSAACNAATAGAAAAAAAAASAASSACLQCLFPSAIRRPVVLGQRSITQPCYGEQPA